MWQGFWTPKLAKDSCNFSVKVDAVVFVIIQHTTYFIHSSTSKFFFTGNLKKLYEVYTNEQTWRDFITNIHVNFSHKTLGLNNIFVFTISPWSLCKIFNAATLKNEKNSIRFPNMKQPWYTNSWFRPL